MGLRKNCRIGLFVLGCLLLNCLGKGVAEYWKLPVWLDAFGTVSAAYVLGPACGAIVGGTTNIIYSSIASNAAWYVLVNIAVGIIVGICARKCVLQDLFGFLSVAFGITLVSVCISTPLNYLFYEGSTGNLWGDGIIAMLQRLGVRKAYCYIAGEFYMDFLDKAFTMLLFYGVRSLLRTWRKKGRGPSGKQAISAVLTFFLLWGAGIPVIAQGAQADPFAQYIRRVYNGEHGLQGGIANDIVQTKDGVLWVGTYGGLYRYYGSEFTQAGGQGTIKTVNCLYTDEAGRLWIGTNDNGLAIYINGEVTNKLTKKDGFPSNSVRCITESADGRYYAGTTDSLVVLTLSGGLRVSDTIPEIRYAIRISADKLGNVAAVTDEGTLYLVRGTQVKVSKSTAQDAAGYRCCAFGEDGRLYAGTGGNTLEIYNISGGQLELVSVTDCRPLSGLNSLDFADDGRLYLCAENGAGYLDANGVCQSIEVGDFGSSLEHMLVDYQGNVWFASSRLGLLCLCKSIFCEIGKSEGLSGNVVNSVIRWQDTLYFGTDSGLEVLSRAEPVSGLVETLQGVRIRCLMEDSKGHLWICTAGRGIWEVTPSGAVTKYHSDTGAAGDKFRSVLELSDGTIAAAGDYGITFLRDGQVIGTIGTEDGLSNPKMLCLYERADGALLAGTDGNGIAVIREGRVTETLKQENGLSSEIILRMVSDPKSDGIFVVTGNGLCYLRDNEQVQQLEQFPYYNNYDIVPGREEELFVLSSAGIYVVDREELLQGGPVNTLLLDSQKGLRLTLTPNAWNYLDGEGNLYLSGDSGAVSFNIRNYNPSVRSYRVLLKELVADGQRLPLEKGTVTVIPSGTSQIVITPQIVNYSVNDPSIRFYLEGYDSQPRILSQSQLGSIVYTDIPSGSYVFQLAVLDSKTGIVITENTYRIEKEPEIYHHWWFRLYALAVAVMSVAYLTWLIVRTQIQKTLRIQRMELEFARNQIQMSNETILTIAQTVDAKDENTSQHSARVAEYSVQIARELDYDEEAQENLRKIALLHDIGKIGIPDSVLNKPTRLTEGEYTVMKSHVTKGAEILKNFTMVENVAEGALYHHERYDGNGYACGLKGEEIPLNARIIGIADAFDAMTANRIYRQRLDLADVLKEMEKGKGVQFDPQLVDILLGLIENGTIDVNKIYGSKETEGADQ